MIDPATIPERTLTREEYTTQEDAALVALDSLRSHFVALGELSRAYAIVHAMDTLARVPSYMKKETY